MGCFGKISNPFRRWYRNRKEKKREKKRRRELQELEARIAEVVRVQGEVEDVQAEVSQHSSLAFTTLDIPVDPSRSNSGDSGLGDLSIMSRQNRDDGSNSSSSDGEGVPLGVKSASNDVGGSSGLSFPMSLVSDDLGPSSFSLRRYQSEPARMCSRPHAVEEARHAMLHQRATESLIAAVSRNILATIPEDEDMLASSPEMSPRSPHSLEDEVLTAASPDIPILSPGRSEVSVSSLPPVVD